MAIQSAAAGTAVHGSGRGAGAGAGEFGLGFTNERPKRRRTILQLSAECVAVPGQRAGHGSGDAARECGVKWHTERDLERNLERNTERGVKRNRTSSACRFE